MPYKYLDDIATADVAFMAWGKTLAEVFSASAQATLGVMVENQEDIRAQTWKKILLEDEQLDLLLLRFLQELIFYKDAEQLLLCYEVLAVEKRGKIYCLEAELTGEKIDLRRHKLGVDVKAVTLHRLSVKEMNGQWQAIVVLDI